MAVNTTNKYRLLIIDDDKDYAQLQATILAGHGYDVRVAFNGEDALQVDADFHPQLALIDFLLEKEHGIDVLDELLEQNPDVHCLMITARAEVESVLLALRHGAVDCLSKTNKTDELLDALKRAAEKLSLREEKDAAEKAMAQRAQELSVANQRLQKEISSRTHAEITALNTMQDLESAHRALKQSHAELASMVQERSDELANQKVQYSTLVIRQNLQISKC